MKLYEPISVTYILISVLIFVIWGETYNVFTNSTKADCYQSNQQLREEQREGPLRGCD